MIPKKSQKHYETQGCQINLRSIAKHNDAHVQTGRFSAQDLWLRRIALPRTTRTMMAPVVELPLVVDPVQAGIDEALNRIIADYKVKNGKFIKKVKRSMKRKRTIERATVRRQNRDLIELLLDRH